VITQIRFDDGAAYERYMGRWSQLAGEPFLGGPSVRSTLATMASEDLERLESRMRARLPADNTGRITDSGRAIKGRVSILTQ
jgi:hypothetical protein